MTENEINFIKNLKQTKAYIHFKNKSFPCFININKSDKRLINGILGEAAFTTGMTGYEETATDPSFLGQHIIYTSAHIGNYSSNHKVQQSSKVHASSLIARNFSYNDFLGSTTSPLISGVDTRSLVKYITNSTNHAAIISTNKNLLSENNFSKNELLCNNISNVSQEDVLTVIPGNNPIVLINYGVKQSIVDQIKSIEVPFVTVPHNITATKIKELNPSLIFLSNGPGDPLLYKNEINNLKEILKLEIPIRAICLGHQLFSLAVGANTIRLPFGQRGINHPVIDHVTGKLHITSQNHGYATDEASFNLIKDDNVLRKNLFIKYSSLFDNSIEGIESTDHEIKTVQFHPESSPGPYDCHDFFKEIKSFLRKEKSVITNTDQLFPKVNLHSNSTIKHIYSKILIIGSGPIKIGQASEFDYSGTQACKALRELGIEVVLINSNPATIMTDPEMTNKTYIEPITHESVKKIIMMEKVEAVISTMGGQTALNICLDLEKEGFFKSNNVSLLGASSDTIEKTEDRELFSQELKTLGYKTSSRFQAKTPEEALVLAKEKVGYPLIIRRDFALGGKGSALISNSSELQEMFQDDFSFPISLEKSLVGYKEIELEVMVDKEQNGIIICSIENIDPCGIHTGDSITVAPAQTISDHCYQQLRTISLNIAKHMKVVAGGANVQFAINPEDENDIIVIEMNPRVSRSSALASKATGYPIAKISALLAVGYTLKDIINDITKASPVAFEPTLDYVAVKIPIFPFNKFPTSNSTLGPQMRSVGEVLSLGGNFIESFMKALRSLEIGLEIPSLTQLQNTPFETDNQYIRERLSTKSQLSLLTVLEAIRLNMTTEQIYEITSISKWFINQMKIFYNCEEQIKTSQNILSSKEHFIELKKYGFSDKYISFLSNQSQQEILEYRVKNLIFPSYKSVDTCSGEFHAKTPYFYSTYELETEMFPLSSSDKSIVVLGSGPNRIGQGIEFDYSCVKACYRLSDHNIKSIMINSNPETVSTDYDSSSRLYISPLYSEDIVDILFQENPNGVITSFSGQTGIKIREYIEGGFLNNLFDFKFLGPNLKILHLTEDRSAFDKITKETELSHTKSFEVSGYKKLLSVITEIGFPVIIRPSYVIGGESMYIFYRHDDVNNLPREIKEQLNNSSIIFQVENYLENAIEYDVDLVRDVKGNITFSICEHIEYAGVHSGDSGMITPPTILTNTNLEKIKRISRVLADRLEIIGPINIQYAVKQDKVYCIEANPRGSRTIPFISKAFNLSLASVATDALLGLQVEENILDSSNYYSVKQSTFPFDRFINDSIILGPKMRSTGETFGIDIDKDSAMVKSYLGNYPNIFTVGKIMMSLTDTSKFIILPYLKQLHKLGFAFYATKGTSQYIKKQGYPCTQIAKINEEGISLLSILQDEQIKMVFNTPMEKTPSKSDGEIIRNTAIQYGIPCFTRIENIKAVTESLIGTLGSELTPISLQDIYKSNKELS
jgi:carbamoyl-phosphate synthase large subunit